MGSTRLKWESPVRTGALPRRHTCISEPLDRPRALASSGVRPFFSVLLTGEGKETHVTSLTSAGANAARLLPPACCRVLRDLRLTRDRLLSRGCARWLGP